MLAEIRTGPVVSSDGAVNSGRSDKTGALVATDGHARYQEAVLRGQVYFACNQAGIASSAGLATAGKNLTLSNPLNSGKNLVLLEVTVALTVVPASSLGAIFLLGNLVVGQAQPASTTAEIVQNALAGGPAGVGKAYNTATLATTPVAIRNLGAVVWVSAAGFAVNSVIKDEVAGALIIPPGMYVSIGSTAAATMQCSMTWEEVAQ